MNIILINRISQTQYYLSKHGQPTLDYKKALRTSKVEEINYYIQKFKIGFKIMIIDANTGEVVTKYE